MIDVSSPMYPYPITQITATTLKISAAVGFLPIVSVFMRSISCEEIRAPWFNSVDQRCARLPTQVFWSLGLFTRDRAVIWLSFWRFLLQRVRAYVPQCSLTYLFPYR